MGNVVSSGLKLDELSKTNSATNDSLGASLYTNDKFVSGLQPVLGPKLYNDMDGFVKPLDRKIITDVDFQNWVKSQVSSSATTTSATSNTYTDQKFAEANAKITDVDTRTAKAFIDAKDVVTNLQSQVGGIRAYTDKASQYMKIDDKNNVFMSSQGGGLFQADADGQVQIRSASAKNVVMYTPKNNKFVANGAGDVYVEAAPGNYAALFANGGQATVDSAGGILIQPKEGLQVNINSTRNNDAVRVNSPINPAFQFVTSNVKNTAEARSAVISLKSGDTDKAVQFWNQTSTLADTDPAFTFYNSKTQNVASITNIGDLKVNGQISAGNRILGSKDASDYFWLGLNGSAPEGERLGMAMVGDGTATGKVSSVVISKPTTITNTLTAGPITTNNVNVNGDATVNGKFLAASIQNNGETWLKGGKSSVNPDNFNTHFNYSGDGKNYIRGDTELRGNNINIGDLNVGGKLSTNGGVFINGKSLWNISEDANGRLCFGVGGSNKACMDVNGNLVAP